MGGQWIEEIEIKTGRYVSNLAKFQVVQRRGKIARNRRLRKVTGLKETEKDKENPGQKRRRRPEKGSISSFFFSRSTLLDRRSLKCKGQVAKDETGFASERAWQIQQSFSTGVPKLFRAADEPRSIVMGGQSE